MKIIISILILALYLFMTRKQVTKGYIFWSFLLILYMSILFSEVVGFPSYPEIKRFTSLGEPLINMKINWVPLNDGLSLSTILNCLCFIPLGVALPVMWTKFEKFLPTLLYGFLFSMYIEVSQFFTLHRVSDITDLLMNTTGVIFGWILLNYVLKWQSHPKNDLRNKDWLVYPVFVSLACFAFL